MPLVSHQPSAQSNGPYLRENKNVGLCLIDVICLFANCPYIPSNILDALDTVHM